MPRAIVEVRGGCVVAVHTDVEGLDVGLLDWDNLPEEDEGPQADELTRLDAEAMRLPHHLDP